MAVTGGVLEIGGTAPATLTVVLPQPVTRVRIHLDNDATVAAHAGDIEVDTAGGLAGTAVSLVADPHGPAHAGWCDRITLTGQAPVRLTEICTDAGPFGWQRYEQWRWSKGIQRSVEAMYRPDPVLRPGAYRLRVRTATVIGGTSPEERFESAEAAFTVGEPPGFATGGTSYPEAARSPSSPRTWPAPSPPRERAPGTAASTPGCCSPTDTSPGCTCRPAASCAWWSATRAAGWCAARHRTTAAPPS